MDYIEIVSDNFYVFKKLFVNNYFCKGKVFCVRFIYVVYFLIKVGVFIS